MRCEHSQSLSHLRFCRFIFLVGTQILLAELSLYFRRFFFCIYRFRGFLYYYHLPSPPSSFRFLCAGLEIPNENWSSAICYLLLFFFFFPVDSGNATMMAIIHLLRPKSKSNIKIKKHAQPMQTVSVINGYHVSLSMVSLASSGDGSWNLSWRPQPPSSKCLELLFLTLTLRFELCGVAPFTRSTDSDLPVGLLGCYFPFSVGSVWKRRSEEMLLTKLTTQEFNIQFIISTFFPNTLDLLKLNPKAVFPIIFPALFGSCGLLLPC